jgi:hypothetical protein
MIVLQPLELISIPTYLDIQPLNVETSPKVMINLYQVKDLP